MVIVLFLSCDQYYRGENFCGVAIEATIEVGNLSNALKNVMRWIHYFRLLVLNTLILIEML
jgi:hypothetical protein